MIFKTLPKVNNCPMGGNSPNLVTLNLSRTAKVAILLKPIGQIWQSVFHFKDRSLGAFISI
jgi:hypothetical protein